MGNGELGIGNWELSCRLPRGIPVGFMMRGMPVGAMPSSPEGTHPRRRAAMRDIPVGAMPSSPDGTHPRRRGSNTRHARRGDALIARRGSNTPHTRRGDALIARWNPSPSLGGDAPPAG